MGRGMFIGVSNVTDNAYPTPGPLHCPDMGIETIREKGNIVAVVSKATNIVLW